MDKRPSPPAPTADGSHAVQEKSPTGLTLKWPANSIIIQSTPPTPAPEKKRKYVAKKKIVAPYELWQKRLLMFEAVDNGSITSLEGLVQNFDTPLPTLKKWLEQREQYEQEAANNHQLRHITRVNNFPVEQRLITFCTEMLKKNVELTVMDLKRRAWSLSWVVRIKDFVATDFWLECFMRRFYIETKPGSEILQCNFDALSKSRANVYKVEEDLIVVTLPEDEAPSRSCRFCNKDIDEAGGMKIKNFGLEKMQMWIKQNIGFELIPVANDNEYPDSLCAKCISTFLNWVDCFGGRAEDQWNKSELKSYVDLNVSKDSATQTTEELKSVEAESKTDLCADDDFGEVDPLAVNTVEALPDISVAEEVVTVTQLDPLLLEAIKPTDIIHPEDTVDLDNDSDCEVILFAEHMPATEPEESRAENHHCSKCKRFEELKSRGPIFRCDVCCELLISKHMLEMHKKKWHSGNTEEPAAKKIKFAPRPQPPPASSEGEKNACHCKKCEIYKELSAKAKVYRCTICCEVLLYEKSLALHLTKQHADVVLRCKFCNHLAGSLAEFNAHQSVCLITRKIEMINPQCSFCQKEFRKDVPWAELLKHNLKCQMLVLKQKKCLYRCDKCGYARLTMKELCEHQLLKHNVQSIQALVMAAVCIICGQEVPVNEQQSHRCSK